MFIRTGADSVEWVTGINVQLDAAAIFVVHINAEQY